MSSLKVGIYSIFTQFNGDDSYNQTNKTATLKLHHYSSYFIIEPATVEMKTGSSYIITGRIYNNYEELVKDNTYEGKTIEFSYKINNKSKTFTIKVDNESKFVFDLGKLGLPASEEAYLVDIGLEIGYGNYIKGNVTVKVVANIPSNISEDLETIYVDTINGNDDTGNATEANPVKSLATALSINDYLGRGKTIFLKAGDYILFPTALDNVTIVGESTDKVKIYQKLEKQTLFTVNNTIIKFVNVSLCDATGKAQNAAAALLQITSSNATFENVKIFNNTAFQSIIRQTGGSNLTIIDSIIYDNSISSTDAIIASADSNVYVKHSTFHNNKGANGGALGFKNGTLTVEDSTFYNNSADGVNSSSDICFVGGNLTITNTTFTNGTGRYHGSIYASGTTETKKQTGGSWYNPIYTIIPGMDANVKITDSKFIKSKETYSSSGKDYGGGAIYFHTCVNAELINDTFIDNHAEAWGGAISLGNATTHIASCVFINNTANKGGSAIFRNTYKTSNSYNSQQKVAPLTIENSVLISSDTSMKTVELYYYSTNASLDNNWWGTNENPETEGLTTATVKTWIVMNLTGERNGESFDLTVTLNTTDSTGTLSPVSSEFSARKAILKGSKGTFDVTEPEVFNGVLKFTYTPNKLLDPGNVTVTVDGLSFVYVPIITETYINITLVNSTADKFTVVLNITTKNGTQAIGGTVTVVVYNRDGTVSNTFTADVTGDLIEIPIDRFTKNGDYKVTANYIGDGNEIYQSENEKTIHVSDIPKQKDKLTIKVISRTNENNKPVIVIMAIIPDDARGTVKVSVTGDEFCDMTNLTLPENLIILTDLESGNYTVDAVYNGDNNYEITVANANFTITNPVSIKSEESEANIGDEIEFTLKDVPEGATVTIFDNGVAINAKIVDNTFTYIAKTSGVHTIQITVTVDGKEQNASTTIYVAPEIIDPISIKSEESEANIGDEVSVTVNNIPKYATVSILDNGVTLDVELVTGAFKYLASTSGVHNITAVVLADGKEQKVSVLINVAKEGTVVVKDTGDDTKDLQAAIDKAKPGDTIILADDKTYNLADVKVNKNLTIVGGKNTKVTVVDGASSAFDIVPLSQDGPENVTIKRIEFVATKDNTTFVVAKSDDTVSGDAKLANIYINDNSVSAAPGVDASKVTLINVNTNSSSFDINKNIDLSGNKYSYGIKESIVNEGKGVPVPTIIATKFVYNDLSVKAYPNSGKFVFTLKNANGKVLTGKTVSITFNGKTFNVKTDARGAVSIVLSINTAKTYPFVAKFAGDSIYGANSFTANVKVVKNSVKIKTNTKKVKKSKSKREVKFTLKTSNDKVLAKKTVKLSINKKTYKVKTNSKGVAAFKVKLANKKKIYKYKVKFDGDKANNKKNYSGKLKVY